MNKIEHEGAEIKTESEKSAFLPCFFGIAFEKTGKCAIFYGYIFVHEPNPTIWRTTMGRQYNKHEKQARRKQYLKRVKLRVKEAIKAAKKK